MDRRRDAEKYISSMITCPLEESIKNKRRGKSGMIHKGLLCVACSVLLSCYNPFFPPMGLPVNNNGSTLRSTAQGVIQQLNNAYNNKDIDSYKDLFSQQQDFRFFIAPRFVDSCIHIVKTCGLVDSICYEIIAKGQTCMYYWTYAQEMDSHTKMFEQADEISLRMSPLNNQDIRYTANGNGETTNVEIILRGGGLDIAEPIQYYSDGSSYQYHDVVDDIGEQVFYLERDPQNLALWVIYKWFDMSQY